MSKTQYTDELKEQIVKIYTTEWSVSEIDRQLNKGAKPRIYGREGIVKVLKEAGVYEGLTGKNYLKKHTARVKRAMFKKHGVENYGQVTRGFKQYNELPIDNIKILTDDYKIYRSAVERLTTKNIKNKLKPQFCEYTGIQFVDYDNQPVNPNDPRKRSIDHKIPIVICYLTDISVEDAADLKNLAFVLRYVNTIKANSSFESFAPIATKIREIFINEGYEHTKA